MATPTGETRVVQYADETAIRQARHDDMYHRIRQRMLDMAAANDIAAAAAQAVQAAAAAAAEAAATAFILAATARPRSRSPSADSPWRRVGLHRRSPSPQPASLDRRKLLGKVNSKTLLAVNPQSTPSSLLQSTVALQPHPFTALPGHQEQSPGKQVPSPHMIPDPASQSVATADSSRSFVVSPYIAAMQGSGRTSQPGRDPSTQSPAATPVLVTDPNLRLPIGHGLTLGPRLSMRHLSHHKQLAGVSGQIQEMVVCAELGASGEEKLGSGRVVVKGNDVAMSSAQGKSRKVELGIPVKFGLCSEPSAEELALAAVQILEAASSPAVAAPAPKTPFARKAAAQALSAAVAGSSAAAAPSSKPPDLDPLQQLKYGSKRPVFLAVVPDAVAGQQKPMGSMQHAFQRARGLAPTPRGSSSGGASTPEATAANANWSGMGVASGPGRLSDGNIKVGSKSAPPPSSVARPSSRTGGNMAQEEDLVAGYRKAAELSVVATTMQRNSPRAPPPKPQRGSNRSQTSAASTTQTIRGSSPSVLNAYVPRQRSEPGQPSRTAVSPAAPPRPKSARQEQKVATPSLPGTTSLSVDPISGTQRRVHTHPPPHVSPPQPPTAAENSNSHGAPPTRFVCSGSSQGLIDLPLELHYMYLHTAPPRPRPVSAPRLRHHGTSPTPPSPQATISPYSASAQRSLAMAHSPATTKTSSRAFVTPTDAAGKSTLVAVGGDARRTLRCRPGSAVATGKTNSRERGGLMQERSEEGERVTVTVGAMLEEADMRAQADLQERVMRVTVQQHTGATAEQVRQLLQMTPEAMARNMGNRSPRAAATAQSRYLVDQLHGNVEKQERPASAHTPSPSSGNLINSPSQKVRGDSSPTLSPPPLITPSKPASPPVPGTTAAAKQGSTNRPSSAKSESARGFHLNFSRPSSAHVDSISSLMQAPTRPQSARAIMHAPVFSLAGGGASSVVKRVRPPSAGSWAGRPAIPPLGSPRAYEDIVYDPEIHKSHIDNWYPDAAVE